MKVDIESIKRSKNIYIFADKTNNLYETDIKNYNKLLINNISKTYKKSDSTIFNPINREAKNIVEIYDIAERVGFTWFESIKSKNKSIFMQYDIKDICRH